MFLGTLGPFASLAMLWLLGSVCLLLFGAGKAAATPLGEEEQSIIGPAPGRSLASCSGDFESAIIVCDSKTVERALQSGVDTASCDSAGQPPLVAVAEWYCSMKEEDCYATMQSLLGHGADASAKDKRENTALHILIDQCSGGSADKKLKKPIELLLKASPPADPKARNSQGKSPVKMAEKRGDLPKVTKLLKGEKDSPAAAATGGGTGGTAAAPEVEEDGGSGMMLIIICVVVGVVALLIGGFLVTRCFKKTPQPKQSQNSNQPAYNPWGGQAQQPVIQSQPAGMAPQPMVLNQGPAAPAPMIIAGANPGIQRGDSAGIAKEEY